MSYCLVPMPTFRSPLYISQFALYEALRRGDSAAYDHLYAELYGPFQFWVIGNSGTEMDAEDAFQKGLMNFLLNLETGKYHYQEGAKVTYVVFEYCKKVWLTELQSARFRNRAAMPASLELPDTADIEQDLERMVLVKAVQHALGMLKDECRNLMQWFYIDELSIREIAERLGMKETSTKSKRYDCTERLKGLYLKTAKQSGL